MEETTTMTLEEQVAVLQEQITFLMDNRATSPAKRLQNIRSECRTKYFGTWEEIKEGQVDYGPEKKGYSDYSAIMDIVRKTTDMLFRYSIGKSNSGSPVASLITSEEGMKEYRSVCENVCKELRDMIDVCSTAGRMPAQ